MALQITPVSVYPKLSENNDEKKVIHHIVLEINQPGGLPHGSLPTTKEKVIQCACYALLAFGFAAVASGMLIFPIASATLTDMYMNTILPAGFIAAYLGFQTLIGQAKPATVASKLQIGPFTITY